MKKIVILTGSELRHTFFRKFIAASEEIEVVRSFCEGQEKSLKRIVEKDKRQKNIRIKHLEAREQAENDYFRLFVESTEDKSEPVYLPKGEINNTCCFEEIQKLKPDLIVAYGCSLIKEPLLGSYRGRFLNVHLGLSPYYRGGGTNYWPLVNGEPEYVGATFMHIDAGVDTGKIIHQIRAGYCWGDTIHQIGNRLILNMSHAYRDIIVHFEELNEMRQLDVPEDVRVYKKKDYTEESVITLYDNFRDGLIEKYLELEQEKCLAVPIIENDFLKKLQD